MKVCGFQVADEIAQKGIQYIQESKTITTNQLSVFLETLGVPYRGGPHEDWISMRMADRLIQKMRAAGLLKYDYAAKHFHRL